MLNKKPFDKNIRHYIQRFTQNLVNLIIAFRGAEDYTVTNEAVKQLLQWLKDFGTKQTKVFGGKNNECLH